MTNRRRAIAAVLGSAAVLALIVGALVRARPGAANPGRYEAAVTVMGTEGRLVGWAPSQPVARAALESALGAARRIEGLMSTYRPDSEISALNRLGAAGPVELSEETLAVLRRSVEFSRLSGGAFDVTYAPLRTLWRRAEREGRLPADEAAAEALAAVGHDMLELGDGWARFAAEGMEVDLGGIAKGFAIDAALEAMREGGAVAGLVDFGGDLRFFGRHPEGRPWRVEIRRPRDLAGPAPGLLEVPACAVTTSGDYERGFTVDGRWFSHIVDPRTGEPVASAASVTVVAPDATAADALSTALSVMGPQDGLALVETMEGVECMMLVRGQGDSVERHASSGFDVFLGDR